MPSAFSICAEWVSTILQLQLNSGASGMLGTELRMASMAFVNSRVPKCIKLQSLDFAILILQDGTHVGNLSLQIGNFIILTQGGNLSLQLGNFIFFISRMSEISACNVSKSSAFIARRVEFSSCRV